MSRTKQLIAQLQKSESEAAWEELLLQIAKPNNIKIQKQQDKNIEQGSPEEYLRSQIIKSKQGWYKKMNQYIKLCYSTRNEPLRILYRLLPSMMQRYIQINYIKLQGLQECLIQIYNNQFRSFNEAQAQRSQIGKDPDISMLYKQHLCRQMHSPVVENLQPITEINNYARNNLKNLVFYLIYREVNSYGPQALADYYRALFIYCGADQKDLNNTGSLYLLEKINKISIFRYSITQNELQWIILTLYQLCTQVKKDKFDLLAVVNAIHKKVSNQSLFRISDLANSLIHLLEDQYSEVFV